MPVLIEGATLLLRHETLERKWPGGPESFIALLPEGSCCDDGKLIAFMPESSEAAGRLLNQMELHGLVVEDERESIDVAVVYQRQGPLYWCRWLELAAIEIAPGKRVLAGRETGDDRVEVSMPEGWSYSRSRSRALGIAKLPPTERPLRFVGHEDDEAIYLDRLNGERVRIRQRYRPMRLVVESSATGAHAIEAEVVASEGLCALGLMHREKLPAEAGMLFRLGPRWSGGFWMKNTLIPLDMLFLDDEGTIVEIVERAQPLSLKSQGGHRPYESVLELNGGWVEAKGIRVGDRVVIGT